MSNEKLGEIVNNALCAVQEANKSASGAVSAIGCAECSEDLSDFLANVDEAIDKLQQALAELKIWMLKSRFLNRCSQRLTISQ